MSKENKERKEKALKIIDHLIEREAGLTGEELQNVRNLIDPPISDLSREEVNDELAFLRERVARLEKMEEYAFELETKICKMRDSIRVWSEALKAERDYSQSTPRLIGVIDNMHSLMHSLNKEFDK